jgi:hypothetical protein
MNGKDLFACQCKVETASRSIGYGYGDAGPAAPFNPCNEKMCGFQIRPHFLS